NSNPYLGQCYFGFFLGGTLFREDTVRCDFFGWSESPSVILATFCSPAWLGIILPESKERATVRKTLLKDIDVELFFEVLALLNKNFERHNISAYSSMVWRGLATEAGLLP